MNDNAASIGELGGLPENEAIERIVARRQVIQDTIDSLAGGRDVTVVAMTKAFGPKLVELAARAGLETLGENYAQELVAKAKDARVVPYRQQIRWHFVGGLQRNKIKKLVGLVDLWETIDRVELIEELAKRQPGARILVQVNTTSEPQKSGCRPVDVPILVERGCEVGLVVEGLMTVGPTDANMDARPGYTLLRQLAERHALRHLSMGMSRDYDTAVAEGATIVRIGSVLFGTRPIRG